MAARAVRFPDAVWAQASERARALDISVSQYLRRLVKHDLEASSVQRTDVPAAPVLRERIAALAPKPARPALSSEDLPFSKHRQATHGMRAQ